MLIIERGQPYRIFCYLPPGIGSIDFHCNIVVIVIMQMLPCIHETRFFSLTLRDLSFIMSLCQCPYNCMLRGYFNIARGKVSLRMEWMVNVWRALFT
jgi:hypothetical protein